MDKEAEKNDINSNTNADQGLYDLQDWVQQSAKQMTDGIESEVGTDLTAVLGSVVAPLIDEYNRRVKLLSSANDLDDLTKAIEPVEKAQSQLDNYTMPEEIANFLKEFSVKRLGTDSRKWSGMVKDYGSNDLLPLWVADMDFKFLPGLGVKLAEKLQREALGYPIVTDGYYQAVDKWLFEHFAYHVWPEWFVFAPGVVSGINWVVQAWTKPTDKVMFFSPIYPPIRAAANTFGRQGLDFPLTCYADGHFSIDFVKLRQVVAREKPRLLILCSPHNPIGRVWRVEELKELLDIAVIYDMLIISDEIHQDLIIGDYSQTSILSIAGNRYADRICVLNSVSKTFNLAGLAHANVLIPNAQLRNLVLDYREKICHGALNTLSLVATEFAYNEGAKWLEQVKEVIKYNYQILKDWAKQWPQLKIAPMEGTYLAFIDLGNYVDLSREDNLASFLVDKCKIAVSYGQNFGADYRTWIRLNLATHPENLFQALAKLGSNFHFKVI